MLIRLTLLALLFFPFCLTAQNLCTGSLGDNIFTNGDFGSGSAPIASTNQGIISEYNYNRTPPLIDGDYVITRNTGLWGDGLYASWLSIPDNSSDPNGYMMVVNASFDPGLFYEQTVSNLCENTLYEFSADIINMIRRGIGDHISPNITFLLNDQEIITTGDIPQDEQWHNFGFTFRTTINQTSVKLSLRNNAPGGIGNDLAIDNIAFRACGPQATIVGSSSIDNVCGLDQSITLTADVNGTQFSSPAFQWQTSTDGTTWTNLENENNSTLTLSTLDAGLTYYRYLLANSEANLSSSLCRINAEPKGLFVVPTASTFSDSFCEGTTYQFGDQTLAEPGTYTSTLKNSLDCDSIVTLQLSQISDPNISPQLSVNQQNCPENDPPSIIITQIDNGAPPYSISLNGSTPSEQLSYTDLTPGDYDLLITDQFGCTFTESYTIVSPINFELSLGNDLSIVLGEQVQLTPESNLVIRNYNWQPSFLCNSNCSAPSWFPTDSVVVQLTATSEEGCIATDEVSIAVDKVRQIQFPNAFSPNNDGLNEVFIPFALSPNVSSIQSLTVYDRWGSVIFGRKNIQPNEISQGWDGQNAKSGIYPYRAEVLFLDGVVLTYTGSVTLIK